LTEVDAGNTFVLALYLAYPDRRGVSPRRLFAAGILFGITVVLRLHLAPAIAVALAWVCGRDVRRRWVPLVAGAALLYQGKSDRFGVVPWFYVLGFLGYFWGGAFAFIVALAILGGRRLALLVAVTGTILATHS
jgi:hypothetical protein